MDVLGFLTTTVTIIFWFIILLVPLVVFHEFGHFLMAKLTKTRVPEFGVGIPPRIIGWRWKGVLWSLNSIPMGGFVRIYGDGDAADSALDALKQIDQNISKDSSDISPKKAKELKKEMLDNLKEQYVVERFQELQQNLELDYFLETQGLVLTPEWMTQIKSNSLDDEKLEQVKTLIAWEFEALPKNKDAFYNKPYFAKLLVMLGGVTANFFLAWVILTVLLSSVNISPAIFPDGSFNFFGTDLSFMSKNSVDKLERSYTSSDMTVARVEKDSIADKQGIKMSDKIVSLNDQKYTDVGEFIKSLERLGGNNVALKVQDFKTGNVEEKKFDLPVKEQGKYQLGVSPIHLYTYKAKNLWDAMMISFDIVWSGGISLLLLLGGILKALFGFTANKEVLNAVGGPVSIGAQGNSIFLNFGLEGILATLALLSINLGIFNLLPVPALDGGRILILTIQRVTGRRNRKLEYTIVTATFILLIIVGIVVMVKDILHL